MEKQQNKSYAYFLNGYNPDSDPLVPALSLISHIKRLRGKMLDARGGRDGHGDEGGYANGNRRDF
jgi:hypothetical protein